jgi:capsular polysaccharide biosynthesis protein
MHRLGSRSLLLVVATLTAAGAAAAAGYALTAPKHYKATAQILVTPVSERETALTGIDLLRDNGGKRTAAASAAALIKSPIVADAVRALLGLKRSRDALLRAVDARVVDASDVVAVTADDTSSVGSARLANAFVDTVVNQRTATFQSEVSAAVRRYTQLLDRMSAKTRGGAGGVELTRRLAVLRTLAGQPDPSLERAGQATAPSEPSSPDTGKLIALGALIGAVVGAVAALGLWWWRRPERPVSAAYDLPVGDDALKPLVDRLDDRLDARESALAARERDLQALLAEIRAAQAEAASGQDARLAELDRRERALEERVAAVTARELELARRAAELAVREREPEPEPEPAPAVPSLPLPAAVSEDGRYNLVALEHLVEERRRDFPHRADEWSSYLYFLREYAEPDGSVPATFDWLIQETFAELVP